MGLDALPRLGLGTAHQDPVGDDELASTIEHALETGYRHVDTAEAYGNEDLVGRAINDSSVRRGEITLATKIHSDNLDPDSIHRTVRDQLQRLDTEYVDVLYVHWPAPPYDPEPTFRALSHLREAGVVRHIGVSNFTPALLREATEYASIAVHQYELHPMLYQEKLLEVTRTLGIWTVAHTPLARGSVGTVPTISEIADTYDATEAQVALAWLLSKDMIAAIPGARGPHLEENFEARSISLHSDDVRQIDGIEERCRFVDPPIAPWNSDEVASSQ